MSQFGNDRRVKVDARAFAAVSLFMSTEEIRYYLNGVFVCPAPEGHTGVLLVATDGHAMGVAHDPDGETNGDWICSVPDVLRAALIPEKKFAIDEDGDRYELGSPDFAPSKLFFSGSVAYLTDRQLDHATIEDAAIINAAHLAVCYAEAIDGKFPDWKRAIPATVGASASITFNPDLFERAQRAVRIISDHSGIGCTFYHGPDADHPFVARSTYAPNFLGVIMPMKNLASEIPTIPDFISPKKFDAA